MNKSFRYGGTADRIISGNWSGTSDGIAIFRPINGYWYFDYNLDGIVDTSFRYGGSTDQIIVGDFEADITSISPTFMYGNNVYMTITGSGFQPGCTVTLTQMWLRILGLFKMQGMCGGTVTRSCCMVYTHERIKRILECCYYKSRWLCEKFAKWV